MLPHTFFLCMTKDRKGKPASMEGLIGDKRARVVIGELEEMKWLLSGGRKW